MTDDCGNVYLVGPMGSGKTTIGKRLAGKLGKEFFDCDLELERHTGASVSLIFDMEGETGFRERETRMLQVLTSKKNVLVATGGGAILRRENRQMLKNTGLVVYLQTSVSQQMRRLARDRSRPLLQESDRRGRLEQLAEERNPVYEELADIVFPAQRQGLDAAATSLAKAVLNYCSPADQNEAS